MAFKSEIEVRKSFKKFIGIDKNAYVLLPYVNLDNKGKEKLGLRTFDDEPTYIKEEEKDGKMIITATIELYAKAVKSSDPDVRDQVYPLRFYITNVKGKLSQSGKYQWINKYGETTWQEAKTAEKVKENNFFHYLENVDFAYQREGELYEFIRNVYNVKVESFERFDMDKIFAGNFKEVEETIKQGNTQIEENKRLFSLLHMIKKTVKTDDKGTHTYYNSVVTAKYGTTVNKIKRGVKNQEEAGWMTNYFWKVDGVLLNTLVEFDEKQHVNLEDTETDDSIEELPY